MERAYTTVIAQRAKHVGCSERSLVLPKNQLAPTGEASAFV